jgi:hypothetical protein
MIKLPPDTSSVNDFSSPSSDPPNDVVLPSLKSVPDFLFSKNYLQGVAIPKYPGGGFLFSSNIDPDGNDKLPTLGVKIDNLIDNFNDNDDLNIFIEFKNCKINLTPCYLQPKPAFWFLRNTSGKNWHGNFGLKV